jgi:hypothetical protein
MVMIRRPTTIEITYLLIWLAVVSPQVIIDTFLPQTTQKWARIEKYMILMSASEAIKFGETTFTLKRDCQIQWTAIFALCISPSLLHGST